MKHSSNNQGQFTQAEYEEMMREGRRKRYIDIIMILEHNGFKVIARQEATDNENTQMIAILKSRGFLVINKKNPSESDKIEMNTLLNQPDIKERETEETQGKNEIEQETEKQGSEGIEEKKTTPKT